MICGHTSKSWNLPNGQQWNGFNSMQKYMNFQFTQYNQLKKYLSNNKKTIKQFVVICKKLHIDNLADCKASLTVLVFFKTYFSSICVCFVYQSINYLFINVESKLYAPLTIIWLNIKLKARHAYHNLG